MSEPLTKVYLYVEEWHTLAIWTDREGDEPDPDGVEVPDALIARWRTALREFVSASRALEPYYEQQKQDQP